MSVVIEFQNVSLKFKTYADPSPTLKDSILSVFSRQSNKKQVSEFYALKNINLTINSGEKVGLIGLNGAGKSTLLKVIAGIYPPHVGRIIVKGKITPLIELGAGINPDFSGRENIFLYGALHGMAPQQMQEREQRIIEFSELGQHINMPVKYYSSGMYSRLIFSIASLIEPDILILDEIFAAGDARFVNKATERMRSLFDQSQAVLFVSHSLVQVRNVCNRVLVIHQGEIVNDGTPEEMIKYYQENMVGSPSVSIQNGA
jgi:ABC-2 type transport system ATP-binding protein